MELDGVVDWVDGWVDVVGWDRGVGLETRECRVFPA